MDRDTAQQSSRWLDVVNLGEAFPNEPLVPCFKSHPSPFAALAAASDTSRAGRWTLSSEAIDALRQADDRLLKSGTRGIATEWRELGVPSGALQVQLARSWEEQVRDGWGYSNIERSQEFVLPNLAQFSDAEAALYLVLIGRLPMPIPERIARAALYSGFVLSEHAGVLSELRPPDVSYLNGLEVDEHHRLVLKLGDEATVLGEGWRRRDAEIFPTCQTGMSTTHPERERVLDHRWLRGIEQPWEQDGSSLVRMPGIRQDRQGGDPTVAVGLESYLPALRSLLEVVSANPKEMLPQEDRQAQWDRTHAAASCLSRRLAEGVIERFTPWPHPFTTRTEAQRRLRPREIQDEVVKLFDRLLNAPYEQEPSNLTAYFMSLIDRRRAELGAWPESVAGGWGFKIKTGDHNWIVGRIWHEPGIQDDLDACREVVDSREHIEASRFRQRYRHWARISAGSLRCVIHRDDT